MTFIIPSNVIPSNFSFPVASVITVTKGSSSINIVNNIPHVTVTNDSNIDNYGHTLPLFAEQNTDITINNNLSPATHVISNNNNSISDSPLSHDVDKAITHTNFFLNSVNNPMVTRAKSCISNPRLMLLLYIKRILNLPLLNNSH